MVDGRTALTGTAALAMSVPDREDRRLVGLVAPAVQSRALQVQRCLRYLDAIDDRLQRFAFMQRLHVRARGLCLRIAGQTY